MKNYFKLSKVYYWLMCFLPFLVSCDKDEIDCGCTSPATLECQTTVLAKQMDCSAYGAFNQVYFRLEDGTFLQPYENATKPQVPLDFVKDGFAYQINYEKVTPDNRYGNLAICELYNPEVANATPVRITCLTTLEECEYLGTVKKLELDGCGLVIESDEGKIFEPVFAENIQADLRDGQRIAFSYEPLEGMASICMAGEMIKITCFQEIP